MKKAKRFVDKALLALALGQLVAGSVEYGFRERDNMVYYPTQEEKDIALSKAKLAGGTAVAIAVLIF